MWMKAVLFVPLSLAEGITSANSTCSMVNFAIFISLEIHSQRMQTRRMTVKGLKWCRTAVRGFRTTSRGYWPMGSRTTVRGFKTTVKGLMGKQNNSKGANWKLEQR
ncbi:hypothetical protein BKA69DRAFT_111698 [Paraphysoderma sedebokerense]|nr:hypothetical protein BKA69DRAFT_111698 [Paraphysoderma sedebokerense]